MKIWNSLEVHFNYMNPISHQLHSKSNMLTSSFIIWYPSSLPLVPNSYCSFFIKTDLSITHFLRNFSFQIQLHHEQKFKNILFLVWVNLKSQMKVLLHMTGFEIWSSYSEEQKNVYLKITLMKVICVAITVGKALTEFLNQN